MGRPSGKALRLMIGLLVVLVLVGAARIWWGYRYPYGASHICNKHMAMAFNLYAAKHGRYPVGEATPEASLSLMYPNVQSPALMAGKGASVERAAAILKSGGLLGPDSCNWNYVEGLTMEDDGSLVILWDKIPGLGHNCERLPEGGHEVLFLDGHVGFIPEKDWQQFLDDQRAKMPPTARFPSNP